MGHPRPMRFTKKPMIVAGCAAFHAAPVTTHHAQPDHTSAPKSAVMMVYATSAR
jgi:hypothetical protein